MKIRCDSCRTRYDIPNARVAGRVLKVRCKRCRHVIEVIGPTAAFDDGCDPTPPTLTAVQAWGSANPGSPLTGTAVIGTAVTKAYVPLESQPIWWAAIGGKPHGPYTREEVLALCGRGDVHARTRLWRAPWGEWERICEHSSLAWAYEGVVERVGRDVAALHAGLHGDVFADAGLVSDGEHYFPDPTLKSGWVVLDEETQRYLETCAARGWASAENEEPQAPKAGLADVVVLADVAAMAPVGVSDRGSVVPALAAACAALVLGVAGTLLFLEGPLGKLLA